MISTKVSLEQAVNTVETLDEIPLPDYQPCIEAINGSIVYKVSLDTNFEDKTAYVTGISKYIEEAAMHAQLVLIISYKLLFIIPRLNSLKICFKLEPIIGARQRTLHHALHLALLFQVHSTGQKQ